MTKRRTISTGSALGDEVGYSRAVIVGNHIEIAATGAADDEGNIIEGDAATQARFILNKIKKVLEEAGAKMEHVVRTRMYVTDLSYVDDVGRVHGEFFKDIKPASSMLVLKALPKAELKVEVEVTAIMDA